MVTETLLTGVFLAPQHGSRCHWSVLRFKVGCLHGPRTKNDSEMYPVSALAMRARKASYNSKSTSIYVYDRQRDSKYLTTRGTYLKQSLDCRSVRLYTHPKREPLILDTFNCSIPIDSTHGPHRPPGVLPRNKYSTLVEI